MELTFTGRDPRTVVADTWTALSQVDWTDPANPPGVVAYTTVVRNNPFQRVLYGALPERAIVAAPTNDLATTTQLFAGLPAEVPRALHLHWLNVVLKDAATEFEARDRLERYVAGLEAVKSKGARLVWTVHNVLPHGSPWPELDTELRQRVADLADLVHVMSPRSVELCAPVFTLPQDRLYLAPHPGYQGVYPDNVGRASARAQLGISPSTTLFVALGALKPYKGLDSLLGAVDLAAGARPGRIAVLVAGRPDKDPATREFLVTASRHAAFHVMPGKVDDADIQVLLRGADVAALPYRATLNSGAFALAQTYDLPAVLPSTGGSAPYVGPGTGVVYDPSDEGGLARALVAAAPLATAEARAAVRERAARTERSLVAGWFADDFRSWLSTGAVPVSRPSGAYDTVEAEA